MEEYEFAIIGFGPAGIFALASLPDEKLEKTLILESASIGGDIARNYGRVKANITKQDIVNAFRNLPRWLDKPLTTLKKYKDEDCPFLSDVCLQMREWILPDMKRANFRNIKMDTITETDQGWRINANGELFETKKLILCIGSEPKKLDLPKPTLPLPICLCKFQLEQHIHKNDRVVVFGTAHSGTLILKHLYEIGCKNTVGIYRSDKPFFFARDGVLGGIKQESAQIADQILNKEWGELTPTLISYDDFSKTYRAIEKADFVLYSIGFKPLTVKYTGITGEIKNLTHDPKTGQFENVKNIWGFGIAFPSFKPDTCFPDIGFNGFIKSIQNSPPLFQS